MLERITLDRVQNISDYIFTNMFSIWIYRKLSSASLFCFQTPYLYRAKIISKNHYQLTKWLFAENFYIVSEEIVVNWYLLCNNQST